MVVGVGWWMVVGWVVRNWVGGGVTGVWVVFECLLDRHQGGVCMIWVISSKGYVQCNKFVNST